MRAFYLSVKYWESDKPKENTVIGEGELMERFPLFGKLLMDDPTLTSITVGMCKPVEKVTIIGLPDNMPLSLGS